MDKIRLFGLMFAARFQPVVCSDIFPVTKYKITALIYLREKGILGQPLQTGREIASWRRSALRLYMRRPFAEQTSYCITITNQSHNLITTL